MRFDFTPAAHRALEAAAGWSNSNDATELRVSEVLVGLLAEPECRAALLLGAYGVDQSAVLRQFSDLQPLATPAQGRCSQFAPEMWKCLDAAERRLIDYPRPLSLATEHLLLGITATDNEVSQWLAECGLYADALEAEIHRLSGHQPGPLPLDIADERPHFIRTAEAVSTPPAESWTTGDEISALRIVDAAANRASEGLRVVEDYLRFALDDRHLTEICKNIRHQMTAVLRQVATSDRHAARETQADVGTQVSLPSEVQRENLAAIVAANLKRVEQALRTLEEFCKAVAPAAAVELEQLRYRVYTLERSVDITRTGLDRLAEVRLYVLVDGRSSASDLRALGEALVDAGVGAIQLRDKQLADRELLARARVLREVTTETDTLLIVNDRPDLATLSGADGVHVGQDELSVKDARRIVGPRCLVGVSTHSLAQARAAVLDGANYIGVGPTFPSTTKQFDQFTGLELLREVRREIRLPAFAIGGINLDNVGEVIATGICRIAVSGAISSASQPAAAARQLLELLHNAAD